MVVERNAIEKTYQRLSKQAQAKVDSAAKSIAAAKDRGGKVVVAVGSGPNIHEGITTLMAELMHKGIIDGVSTSSATVAHEMAGTLEKVKRVDGAALGIDPQRLPADGRLEVSLLTEAELEQIQREVPVDEGLYRKMRRAEGNVIIKVAGNIAYPTGLRTERLARDVLALSQRCGVPFELMAGHGADPHTMIGAGALLNLPVLVSVPQLVGGGEVGLAIGDSLSISERSRRLSRLFASADVIIESALALSQEIHDGPFERFTGHGMWADWEGGWTYSLREKAIIRIDLDPNIEKAWHKEKKGAQVTGAVQKGLPKTVSMNIPFRMEMSGFARVPGSQPVVGDIGEIWPVLALRVADLLGVNLDFVSYKQSLPEGEEMREWIVKKVKPIDRERMFATGRGMVADLS